jgi:ribosome-binding ATPase YchF (GTP1/OBG family)
VSVLLHVVRCFEDDSIDHIEKTVDPIRDMETIQLELILSDMDTLEKIKKKMVRSEPHALPLVERTLKALEQGRPASEVLISENEWEIFKNFRLLSAKPTMLICNVKENSINGNQMTEAVERKASEMGLTSLVICAKMEEEIVNMDEHCRDGLSNERLLEELAGIKESGISRIIKACKILLNLNSFYTAGPIESRSWSISRGTKAREAASLIHTDIAKGFIKAEVMKEETFFSIIQSNLRKKYLFVFSVS